MKKIALLFVLISKLSVQAQNSDDAAWMIIGTEFVKGNMSAVSAHRGKDSYGLLNYVTVKTQFYGDRGLNIADFSGFAYYLMNLASQDKAQRFANIMTHTDRYMQLIEDRTLFEYSLIKNSEGPFRKGFQMGFHKFGFSGYKYNSTNGTYYAEFPDTGPYFSRIALFGGLSFNRVKAIGEHLNLRAGLKTNLSLAVVSVGAQANPYLDLQLKIGRVALFANAAFSANYYYAPTQRIFQNKQNPASNTAFTTSFRYSIGLAIDVRP